MKPRLLDYLVCPDCQVPLTCSASGREDGEIWEGALGCAHCGNTFPITGGIPRFVSQERPLQGQNVQTADAFGWEWQEFSELHDLERYREQFLDWIDPLEPEYFQEKVVLDAGCGMGRFSMVSSTFGAREILAIDASDAVEAAQRNTNSLPNVHVVQADILNLPLRTGSSAQMDFIFSIGVLHHLDKPQNGFIALADHLQAGGSIFAWVYGRENNEWLIKFVNPLRTLITSRLPRRALYHLSLALTIVLHPLAKYVYRPVKEMRFLHGLYRTLPYRSYLSWLGQFGFRHNHHIVFDHLVAPVAFYIPKNTFVSWFRQADLELLHLSARNENSWRGHGLRVAEQDGVTAVQKAR